ncbi:hypothetical protein EPI10_015516 [Gossypium australe]|uniref:Uncharacterized protein n=1 Tax=Gossypium australe TaxID=47621 RepID=A0A5B6VKU5_9ROSI|nr:hypothetical protein EPI10_015516 [Gossypium australe]
MNKVVQISQIRRIQNQYWNRLQKERGIRKFSPRIVNKNAITKQPQQMEGRPPPPFPQRFQISKQDLNSINSWMS